MQKNVGPLLAVPFFRHMTGGLYDPVLEVLHIMLDG